MPEAEQSEWRDKREKYANKYYLHPRTRQVLRKMAANKKLTSKQEVLSEYGNRLSQLESACSRLERYPIWLASCHVAVEKQGISRVDQFIYHIENYLSSVYIFEQRAKKFIKYVEKLAIKKNCSPATISSLRNARTTLSAALNPLIEIRGNHTHDRHFQDKEIDKVELFDKAGDFSQDSTERKEFKANAKFLLNIQRRRWKRSIKEYNQACKTLLGIIYQPADKLIWEIYKKT